MWAKNESGSMPIERSASAIDSSCRPGDPSRRSAMAATQGVAVDRPNRALRFGTPRSIGITPRIIFTGTLCARWEVGADRSESARS